MTMSTYEERKARALRMPPRPRPLTEDERRRMNYDWRTFRVVIGMPSKPNGFQRTRTIELEADAANPADVLYRAGLRLRKDETIKETSRV